ncbi:MAG: DUF2884 family protein [Lysobacteraceae bacterium]|nr:MAG: DUF2884 family protein [Xanthomonadaceae bacterium]
MKTMLSTVLPLSLAVALLAGCNPGATVVTDSGSVIKAGGKEITLRAPGQPDAKISAAGDLEVDGKAVEVDATQRALLQSYHQGMSAVTAEGIAIGKQGAALAGKAVSEAIKGAIRGDTDNVESKVKADAARIKTQALQLCRHLATVKTSQDALAASLAAFKPYATLSQSDVDECASEQDDSYAAGKEFGGTLGKTIKEARDEPTGMNAAEQADAAATEAEAPEAAANSR